MIDRHGVHRKAFFSLHMKNSTQLLLFVLLTRLAGVRHTSRPSDKWTVPACESTAYEGVPKSFRTGRLERKLQMVQVSATRCNYMAIL
jgi:hypothetical protein